MKVWDYVESITFSKEKLQMDKSYSTFTVNRALSYHVDTILYANEMNMLWDTLDHGMQYDFLRKTIRAKRRYGGKWPTQKTDESVDLVMKFYNYGRREAMQAVSVMTPSDIDKMREEMERREGTR